jgi:hypothetical protein
VLEGQSSIDSLVEEARGLSRFFQKYDFDKDPLEIRRAINEGIQKSSDFTNNERRMLNLADIMTESYAAENPEIRLQINAATEERIRNVSLGWKEARGATHLGYMAGIAEKFTGEGIETLLRLLIE